MDRWRPTWRRLPSAAAGRPASPSRRPTPRASCGGARTRGYCESSTEVVEHKSQTPTSNDDVKQKRRTEAPRTAPFDVFVRRRGLTPFLDVLLLTKLRVGALPRIRAHFSRPEPLHDHVQAALRLHGPEARDVGETQAGVGNRVEGDVSAAADQHGGEPRGAGFHGRRVGGF